MNFKAAIGVMGCFVFAGAIFAGVPKTDPPKTEVKSTVAAATNAAAPKTDDTTENADASAEGTETSSSPSAAFANAAKDANPYAIIIERNIFHLNPPPPPPTNNDVPPPNIKITGIMKMDKGYQALFAIPPKDAKDATEYLCMSEGEKMGVLELVKIFPDKEECDVVNAGIRMTLSFKNNSYNPPKPAGQPGQPGQPPMNVPPPPPQPIGMNPQPQQQAAAPQGNPGGVVVAGAQTPAGGGNTGNNNRGVIVAGGYTGGAAPGGGVQSQGQVVQPANPQPDNSGLRQIPTRTLRLTPQGSIQTPAPQAQQNLHPDVQLATMVVQHASDPNLPPALPPVQQAINSLGGGPPPLPR